MTAPETTKQDAGVLKAGWICLGIGLVFCLFDLGFFFCYGPLFLAAFVLSIMGIVRGRTTGGLVLLLTTIVAPLLLIAWIYNNLTL